MFPTGCFSFLHRRPRTSRNLVSDYSISGSVSGGFTSGSDLPDRRRRRRHDGLGVLLGNPSRVAFRNQFFLHVVETGLQKKVASKLKLD